MWAVAIPMAHPFLRYTLVYAIRHGDGVLMIDAGSAGPEAWAALMDGLETAGLGHARITDVMLTHWHRDHTGLARQIAQVHDADVHLSEPDWLVLNRYAAQDRSVAHLREELDRRLGLPPREWPDPVVPDPLPPSTAQMLHDGQMLKRAGVTIEVLMTPGHSPGHCCFRERDRRLLFTGDHVLPHVSPNISVQPVLTPSDPLGDYLGSLGRIAGIPADHVLPGHEYVFTDVGRRATELIDHHHARLVEILSAVRSAPGSSAAELVPRLAWSRSIKMMNSAAISAAAGETLAHLVHLLERGEVSFRGDQPRRWWIAVR